MMKKIIGNIGSFYLGKHYDLNQGKTLDQPLYYNAKDLCTHAVCLGMTGSGKTGLCLSILEEAILDGIPIIAIDPKGDLSNLALNSPNFAEEDYQQWVDPGKARSKALDIESFAHQEAKKWQEGNESWQQDSARLKKLKDASNLHIYTPGSNQGLQVSVLQSFDKPVTDSPAELNECAEHWVESLLSFMGEKVEAQSPEFVFLSSTLLHLWRKQAQVSLANLIREIQTPSQKTIGVMTIDQFISEKKRLSFAMKINALLASPSFSLWSEGVSMDIQRFLWDEQGLPKTSVFSIAHLNDDERMFFVSTLLNEITHWMRQQPGTSSLRALIYMDEIYGFLPPVNMPPSKKAFLTLLKQARAYGLGLMLATQNPADLDYKALSNIGTWFLGRLQTKQDQNKVIEGLETLGSAEHAVNKSQYQNFLGQLPSRVFMMKNIHEITTLIFHTRWAMSYLKGPMTLKEINLLMKNIKPLKNESIKKPEHNYFENGLLKHRPHTEGMHQKYIWSDQIFDKDKTVEYVPALSAHISMLYQNNTYEVAEQKNYHVIWIDGEKDYYVHDTSMYELNEEPEHDKNLYRNFSKLLLNEKKRNMMISKFKHYVYNQKPLIIYKDDQTKLISKVNESKNEFLSRSDLIHKQFRDEKISKLKESYASKIKSLENKKLVAEQKVEKEHSQYDQSKWSTFISLGTALLGTILGRKVTRGSVDKFGTTLRGAAKIKKEKNDILMAQENVAKYELELSKINDNLNRDLKKIAAEFENKSHTLKEIVIRPSKSNIMIERSEIVWLPKIDGRLQVLLS